MGRPLTWSEPEPAEIERNFEEVTKIYQAFYGFSKSQLMFTNVVLNK